LSLFGDTIVSGKRASRSWLTLLGAFMIGCTGTRPAELGLLPSGTLRPCPSSPNCVSSEAGTSAAQRVEPFAAPGGTQDLAKLATLVGGWPRAAIITSSGGYLHAEFTSLIMRFVDDVEFRYDTAAKVIHVRSASRLGKSDLGVNRKRVEALRQKWITPSMADTPPR
jgi:uncharacterized protein (DUF1499 family)